MGCEQRRKGWLSQQHQAPFLFCIQKERIDEAKRGCTFVIVADLKQTSLGGHDAIKLNQAPPLYETICPKRSFPLRLAYL